MMIIIIIICAGVAKKIMLYVTNQIKLFTKVDNSITSRGIMEWILGSRDSQIVKCLLQYTL